MSSSKVPFDHHAFKRFPLRFLNLTLISRCLFCLLDDGFATRYVDSFAETFDRRVSQMHLPGESQVETEMMKIENQPKIHSNNSFQASSECDPAVRCHTVGPVEVTLLPSCCSPPHSLLTTGCSKKFYPSSLPSFLLHSLR